MPTVGFEGDLEIEGNDVGVGKEQTLNRETEEVDVTQRQSDGLKQWKPGMEDVSIDVTLGNDPTDPQWIKIRDAVDNRTTLANVRIKDGEATEVFYELSVVHAFGFSKEQAMDGEQIWKTTLRPAPGCVASFGP